MDLAKSRTWVEVSLEAIRGNVRAIRAALPRETRFLGVVKANAYGHGAVPVAKAILEAGGEYLAVACLSEAAELREAGITAPILILGVTPAEFAPELLRLDVTQAVSGLDYARELSARLTGPLKCHLKLETGMGRTGFPCGEDKLADIIEALSLPKLDFEGVFTHFAVSDSVGDPFTQQQHRRFVDTVEKLEKASGRRFAIKHCANSGAVINYKEMAHDMVRPGVITYGMYPAPETGGISLRPALSLRTRVYAITEHKLGDTISYGRAFTVERDTRLAVLPIGYADGLSRNLSGRMDVLLHGKRCPQVGRICMDMCMVDITDLPQCRVGDVATVIGADGGERILADELAEKLGTIHYEITCGLSVRVPRLYD
ncbi:MAG: alanine racemase [Oscillospiraceae bacterium]